MSSSENPQPSSLSLLTEKVHRSLQVRSDTPAMKAALDALAALSVNDSTMDARSVRVAMEQDAWQQAMVLQTELQRMVAAVSELRQDISNVSLLAQSVQEIVAEGNSRQKFDVAGSDEAAVAAQLADAFQQRRLAQKRLEAVSSFLERFDLSAADARLLDQYNFEDYNNNASSQVNGLAFLSALERVRQIRNDLSGSIDPSSTSALRMMEHLAQKQERAYERLYSWFQSIANNSADDNEDVWQQDFVKRAFYTLRHVPAFYEHALELLAHSRRSYVTKRFLVALTAGPAPMEMKAHDPVVYVGEMLAFVFTTFSVEGDVAKGLLTFQPSSTHDDSDRDVSERSSEETKQHEDNENKESIELAEMSMSLTELWSTTLSGLTRPLKSRILQVVASLARRSDEGDENDNESDDGFDDEFEDEVAVFRSRIGHLYEISGLLLFYIQATQKSLQKSTDSDEEGRKNPLVTTLVECLQEATEAYEATIRAYGAMFQQLEASTGNSGGVQAQAMISQLIKIRVNSPGFEADIGDSSEAKAILSLDWASTALISAALNLDGSSIDDILALSDIIQSAKSAGLSEVTAHELQQSIQQKEAVLVEQLVQAETQKVLDLCGLKDVADSYRRWESQAQSTSTISSPMVSYPGLSTDQIERAVRDFYASLYSPPLPSLETTVKDPLLRKRARSQIAVEVAAVYSSLYQAYRENANVEGGYDDLSFWQHSPEQVNTLFSA